MRRQQGDIPMRAQLGRTVGKNARVEEARTDAMMAKAPDVCVVLVLCNSCAAVLDHSANFLDVSSYCWSLVTATYETLAP